MRNADPSTMNPTTWSVLRALRAGANLSRNRHFELFEDSRFRRARRLHVFLRSIVEDLRRFPDEVSVERLETGTGNEGWAELRIEFPVLHGRRICFLNRVELGLLSEEAPEVASLIESLL